MQVEVDQSIKINQPGVSYIAFSNDISDVIKVVSKVKQAGRLVLKERHIQPNRVDLFLWIGCVYLLLEPHLHRIVKEDVMLVIDNEYAGHQRTVKAALLRYIRRKYSDYPARKVAVESITKKSPAHKLAWAVRRRKIRRKARTLTVREISDFLAK